MKPRMRYQQNILRSCHLHDELIVLIEGRALEAYHPAFVPQQLALNIDWQENNKLASRWMSFDKFL